MGIIVRGGAAVRGEIQVREYPAGVVDGDATREALAGVEPSRTATTQNAMQVEWFEWLVRTLNPTNGLSTTVSQFAVGTNGRAATTTDGGLFSEVYRGDIDAFDEDGMDFVASCILDSNEANGYTLREAGLTAGGVNSGLPFVNRGVIPDTVKTDQKIVTIDFTIRHSDGGT